MTGAPDAVADAASISQRPAAKKPDIGSRPSTLHPAGRPVNQVGGSMIAVSVDGYAPVTGLFTPPSLFQNTMPLQPAPPGLRVAEVRPVTSAPFVRNAPPFAPPPM